MCYTDRCKSVSTSGRLATGDTLKMLESQTQDDCDRACRQTEGCVWSSFSTTDSGNLCKLQTAEQYTAVEEQSSTVTQLICPKSMFFNPFGIMVCP